ncbi:uncharacterized protein LOC111711902 [Eurytemora carolleeae]|uniref:uncharacterized protein LOC111711902 n=1 Tax=Eurytemora carolleeae TaxID=1294199 RepID=UPI000C768E7A|nr:uncharacterized protein LOC111711902 [Eurytemora carolleeae]|eukprot:XP_023342156.1 uncharacterized protein LOC111711902 [Eurytemora affinis]
MGSEVSKNNDGSFTSPGPIMYFSIILKDPDKMHIVPYDNIVSSLVVRSLDKNHKVLDHRPVQQDVYMIKVAGSPFSTSTIGDSDHTILEMKMAWCDLLSVLIDHGWRIISTSSLAQRRSGSTIFFRKMVGQLAAEPSLRPLLCMTTSGWDKLLFLNLPGVLVGKVSQLVETIWGIQDSKTYEKTKNGCTLQLKLVGSPWSGVSGEYSIKIRKLILSVLKLFQSHSIHFTAKVNFNRSTDSVFFLCDESSFSLATPENMFCLSLNKYDRLRVIEAPSDVLHLLPGLIQQSWPYGIQQVRDYHSSQEYKLGSSPWWCDGEDGFHAKRLVSSLVAGLKFTGWDVLMSLNISSVIEDKSIIVFRQKLNTHIEHQHPKAVKQLVDWVSVSFHGVDKIRFCSGPGAKTSNHEAIAESIRTQLKDANFLQKEKDVTENIEWKVVGTPFSGTFGTGEEQRSMLLYLSRLLQEFNRNGWKLSASLNISSKYHATKREKYKEDADCWVFLEEPSDRLHLAALNPPSIVRYLGQSREDVSLLSSQFDQI